MEDPWPPTAQTLPAAVSGIWISFLAGSLNLHIGHSSWSQAPGGELLMLLYSKSPLPVPLTSQRELQRTGPRCQTVVAAGLNLLKKTSLSLLLAPLLCPDIVRNLHLLRETDLTFSYINWNWNFSTMNFWLNKYICINVSQESLKCNQDITLICYCCSVAQSCPTLQPHGL